jgi:hypothetical protein
MMLPTVSAGPIAYGICQTGTLLSHWFLSWFAEMYTFQ